MKLYHYQYLIHYFEIEMNETILENYTMLLITTLFKTILKMIV